MSGLSLLEASRSAAAFPAIVTRDRSWTFGELAPDVRRIMRKLRDRADPAAGVAVVAHLRLETILLFYAAMELGLPIFPLHPRLTAAERESLAAMCSTSVLDEGWSRLLADASDVVDAPGELDPEAVLATLFTSGSSGTPKGVVLSRRAFVAAASANAQNLGWTEDDRWLLCMPLGHVGGLSVITRCLIARRPVVLAPWTGDVRALLADIEATEVTILSLVPTMLRRILDLAPPGRVFGERVRVVLLGGDASSAALLEEAAVRGIPFVTTYGMTEACSQVATQRPAPQPSRTTGVGPPLPGTEVRIADGEILVRSATLMSGYFPPDRWPTPFDADGWFATRDLGAVDERGNLHVRGRKSDLIITGGENVDPQEVEAVVAACEGVKVARVFGVPDEAWGQVVAVVVVPQDPGTPPRITAIARAIEQALATHKRPRAIAFCDELPVSASGKLDRKGLATTLAGALQPIPRTAS